MSEGADRKLGFKVVAENETGAAFNEIKQAATQMAASVKQAGEQAAKGIEGVGDGGEKAAAKMERSASNLTAQIRRVQESAVVAALAGDSLAKAFEIKADFRGLDTGLLKNAITELSQYESQVSVAKAMAHEMSQVAAFTKTHEDAKKLVKDAEYVRFWASEMDKADASAKQAAAGGSFLQSLKSQSDAIGKTRADLLEMQAAQMGLTSQAAPMIAKLREAEQGVGKIGVTAGQTRMALQQLPMQFQDIVVSLQAGQAPLTVLLQQGSQLAGSFGGAGAAAKAMGSYILGLVNPYTVAAASVAALGVAYYQGSQEADNYRKALLISGNQVGSSVEQLGIMARQISNVTGTQSAAAAALAEMAQKSKVGSENLREYTTVAMQWEKATGQAVGETAAKFAELAKDPLSAILKINEEMNILTASTYDQIKALEKQGQTTEAATLSQKAYSDALKSRQKEIVENLGYVERAYKAVGNAASWAWDQIAGIGRPSTPMSQVGKHLDELQNKLELKLATGPTNDLTKGSWEKGVENLKKEIQAAKDLLGAGTSIDSYLAGIEGKNKAYVDSMEDFDKVASQYASKEEKRKTALAFAETKYREAVEATKKAWADSPELKGKLDKLDAGYKSTVTGINKQFTEKGSGGISQGAQENAVASIKARILAEEELIKRLKERGVAADSMSESDKLVMKLEQEIAGTTNARTKANLEVQLAEAKRYQATQQSRIELEKLAKAQDEGEKSYRKYIDGLYKSADAMGDMADKQDAANASFGKSKVAIAEMAMEQAKLAAANAKDAGPWTPEQIAVLEKLASEHERYVKSLKEGAYIEASRKYEDDYKSAKAELELQQYSMSLLGVEEAKRQQLLAIRKSELAVAIEIDKINKQSYSADPTVDEQRKADLIARIRLNAETNLQTELSRIQEQSINEQVQKYDQIFSQGFADMLNNGRDGWKSFTKSLTTTFKTQVADQIYKMFARPIVVQIVAAMSGFMGGGFGSSAAQIASGGSNIMGMAGNASSMWNAISGGLNASASLGKSMLNADWFKNLGNEALQEMLGQFGAGMMNTASWSAASQAWSAGGAQMAGLVAGSLMNGFAGYGISRMLSGGYSAGGWVNTAAGIASMIPGIGPIAGVVGGIINRAFGRKLKDAGIEGEFGGETGFEGRQFEFYKGGWFRSDKTKYKDLEESTRAGFADQFTVLRESVESMGESLGLGSDLLMDFTYKMKLSLKGLSEEEAAKKIQEEFDKIANSMGDAVLATKDYSKEGETQLEALTRLSTSLVAVNSVFDTLGATLLKASLASADWASSLIEVMGGLDKFSQAAATYYDLYYSDDEKRAQASKVANKGMEEMGLGLRTTDADAKKKYRELVDKAIADKDEELLAWLLQFADDFAHGVDAVNAGLEEATNSAVELMQKQLDEIQRVRDETLNTLGLSIDGLVDGFITEVNEGRGAQAGQWLADTIASGFEQAIYGQALTIVMNSIIDGVITPVVTAAMTGSSVSAAVSGAAIDTMVANATAAADALNTLLQDPAFKEAMEKVLGVVRDLGNGIGQSIPVMSTYRPAVQEVTKAYEASTNAADEAAKAAQKLADEWSKLIDSIQNEMDRLRGSLLGASGDQGASYYESMFAIKTAQARAGDQDAAAELPSLIQKLEEIAKGNASSQSDVLLKQAEWLASLTDTRNYLAGKYGVDISNQKGAEVAATTTGRIIQTTGNTAVLNALQSSSDNPALLAEVRALRAALETHDANRKAEALAITPPIQRLDKRTWKWDVDGTPATRKETA